MFRADTFKRKPRNSLYLFSTLFPSFLESMEYLNQYEELLLKNASQITGIEASLRSLTYILPGERDKTYLYYGQLIDQTPNLQEGFTTQNSLPKHASIYPYPVKKRKEIWSMRFD